MTFPFPPSPPLLVPSLPTSPPLPSIPFPLLSSPPRHPLCSPHVLRVTPLLQAHAHIQIYTRKHTRGNALAHTHSKPHTHGQQRRTQTHANAHTAGRRTWRRWTEERPRTAQNRPKPRRLLVYISVGFPRSHPHTPHHGGFHLGRGFKINGSQSAVFVSFQTRLFLSSSRFPSPRPSSYHRSFIPYSCGK